MELEDMPQVCNHQKRSWRNDRTGAIAFAKHMPTVGRDTHRLTGQAPMEYGVRRVVPWSKEGVSPYVSESLSAYPDLLNENIVAKLRKAGHIVMQAGPTFARPAPEQPAARAQASFKESVHWRDPLRGAVEPTDKDKADAIAIDGLRNTSESLGKLSFTSAYGIKFGEILKQVLDDHP